MNFRVIAAAFVGALCTSLVLWAWARRNSRREHGSVPLSELARRYRRWEHAGAGIIVLACVVCWLALMWIAGRYPAPDPAVLYRLTPHPLYWAAAAFFLGILTATGPTHLLYSWLMGERFAEFRSYQTRKFGFDSGRLMVPFYLVFGSATVAVVVLLLNWYVLFGSDGIVVDSLGSLSERHYSYEQVMQIRTAERMEQRDGVIANRYGLVLHFDDGSHWSSHRDPSNASPQRLREIAEFISERSSLPIVEVSVLMHSEL